MKIKFYTADNCPKCKLSLGILLKKVPEELIELIDSTDGKSEETQKHFNFLKSEGYKAFPVIIAEGLEPFNDFKPNKLKEVASMFGANEEQLAV